KKPRPPGKVRPELTVTLTCARKHRTDPIACRGHALRIHERAADVVGWLGAREPPHGLEVREEERVEDRVLGRRVAARVAPEPVAAGGHHERLPDALRHVPERAPLLLREAAGALERAPCAGVSGLAAPDAQARLDPRTGVKPGGLDGRRRLLEEVGDAPRFESVVGLALPVERAAEIGFVVWGIRPGGFRIQ